LVDGPESERHDLDVTLSWALKVGENNLKGMGLLDKVHKRRFGTPSPANVSTTPIPGKVNIDTFRINGVVCVHPPMAPTPPFPEYLLHFWSHSLELYSSVYAKTH